MNRTELIKAFAASSSMPQKPAEELLNNLLDIISQTLAKNEDVRIMGFGTFKMSKVESRTVTNPQSGKKMQIDSYYRVRFVPGQVLKDIINPKKTQSA